MRVRELALYLLVLATVALQVQPTTVTIEGGSGTEFDQVFTLVNDLPRPLSVKIVPSLHSEYLTDAVLLSEQNLAFSPRETKNLQVRGTVPALGPEVHRLQYDIVGDGTVISSFVVRMPIEGEPKLHAQLDLDVQDVVANEPVSAELILRNFGNVIAYYTLTLRVKENAALLGEITYPAAEQILPGDEKELTLLFTEILDPGSYNLEVSADVNGVEQLQESVPFRVVLVDEKRTISVGEDLVLRLKNYDGFTSVVTYILREGSNELARDTVTNVEDELTLTTSSLPEGEYTVEVLVAHDKGTDKTVITLEIKEAEDSNLFLILGIAALGVLVVLIRKPVMLFFRVSSLTVRVWRKEWQMRRLVRRAHKIADMYGSRRTY